MSRGADRVGDLVRDYLRRSGLEDQVERVRVLDEWGERVGEAIAEVTSPRSVSGEVLIVEVRSSAWLMELNLMKREILERLNEGRSGPPVAKIRFVLAERG